MKKIIFGLCLCISISIAGAQTTISYIESGSSFANPERGFQKYSITNAHYNHSTNYTNLSQSTLTGWRTGTDKVTIIFRYFLLNNFLNSDISQTYLNNIRNDFNIIRNAGLKCIVRFSYSKSYSPSAPQQPTKSRILTHINQIAPLLAANKDIIYTHQAGFIGTWGEWYYTNSTEFGTGANINATQWANRKEILDALLTTTPKEILIQVRYPKIKKTMYGTSLLTESTAYRDTPHARIGFYNDAFLNIWGDMGTYSNVGQNEHPAGSPDYLYLSNETKYTPMSGETNGTNEPRTNGNNAKVEMHATHWSTLNRDYHEEVITSWINSGDFSFIKNRLGYRFVLRSGTFNLNRNILSVNITLQNIGFARLVKPRNVVLVLLNTDDNNRYTFTLNTDPRTWEGEVSFSQNINISTLPAGNYSVHLQLPDIDPALADRPEYSIRFANSNTWDNTQGYNNLGYSFSKTTAPTPVINCPPVDVIVDGNNNEWFPVSIFAQKNGEILKIYNNDEFVYFQFSGNSFVNYQIYIDTNNGITGYNSYNWPDLYANLMIENNHLYQYTGTGTTWSWSNPENIVFVKNNGILEVKMNKNYFQNNSFKIGFKSLNASWKTITALPRQNENTEYPFCSNTINNNLLTQFEIKNDLNPNQGKNDLRIFPNPADNTLVIQSDDCSDTPFDIAVFSIEGRLIKSKKHDPKHHSHTDLIDISFLPAGSYVLKLKTKEKIKTVKFQKKL